MFLMITAFVAASAQYPGEIANYTGSSTVEQCTICHTDNLGGLGTVTRDFGKKMKDTYGLVCCEFGAFTQLHAALDQDKADNSDVDGDGVIDFDELTAGTDPNVANAAEGEGEGSGPPGGGPGVPKPIEYGFGCSSSSSTPTSSAEIAAL